MNAILLIFISYSMALPLYHTQHRYPTDSPLGSDERAPDPSGVGFCDQKCQSYLIKYGYLRIEEQNNIEHPQSITNSNINVGLKNLQKEAGLEETGFLNYETTKLFKTPRCGVIGGIEERPSSVVAPPHEGAERPSSFVKRQKRFATFQGWSTVKNEKNETVVSWSIDLSNANKINTNLSSDTIRSIFANALSKWSTTSLLHFKESRSNMTNIAIKFAAKNHGDPFPFDGPGNVLAHAYYPGTSLQGQVHLDLDETWSLYDDSTSMYHVALHELGHAIGLAHSSQSSSIMYAWYTNPVKYDLSDDDTLAVNSLYGVKPRYRFGPITPTKPTKPTKPKPTTRNYYGLKNLKLLVQNSKIFIYPKSSSLSFN
jgi:hypothetical protein